MRIIPIHYIVRGCYGSSPNSSRLGSQCRNCLKHVFLFPSGNRGIYKLSRDNQNHSNIRMVVAYSSPLPSSEDEVDYTPSSSDWVSWAEAEQSASSDEAVMEEVVNKQHKQ
jgi:hypothetical protein